jgi:colicin import membrane protein
MARKLKTFQDFYDPAIAGRLVKAALEAWAPEAISFIRALRRRRMTRRWLPRRCRSPGWSSGGLRDRLDASLNIPSCPTNSSNTGPARNVKRKRKKHRPNISDKAARQAGSEFERAQGRRDAERRREEAALARERERREKAITKAQAAVDEAKEEHEAQASAIEAERAAIEKRTEDEDVRWKKLRDKLGRGLIKTQP